MLAGECPFDGETSHVLLTKTSRPAPSIKPLCPGLPDHVALTISRMLAREPAGRPESMAVVAASIASWRAEVAPAADQPPGRFRRRWKRPVYPAGAALLGALAVTLWLGRDAPRQPAAPDRPAPLRTVSRQSVVVERPPVVDMRPAEEERSAGSSQPRSAEVAAPTRETGSVSPPSQVRSKTRARRRSTRSRPATGREPVAHPEPQGREEPDPRSRLLIADPFEE
jgi:hypothetical protein